MIINYDATVVSFVRTENSSQIKSGTMVTNSQSNPIYGVYVCNTDQTSAPALSGNIISFVFKVNDDVREGKTKIGAHIDEVCNYQAKQLNLNFDEDLTLHVEPEVQLSAEAYLTTLTPLKGTLAPQFAEDVFTYTMRVNDDVTSVEFAATAGENGRVKINRKTLQKAGSNTAIIATVTSADQKTTSQYVVTVSRAEKPATADSVNSAGTGKGEKASSGKNVQTASHTEGEDSAPKFATSPGEVLQQMPGTQLPEAAQPQAQQQPLYASHGDRNIYIIGNQMPTYVVGMLTAALCIMIGIALSFWLKIRPKK